MKFYALVLWRTRGVVASQLKLLYLGDGEALNYAPDEGSWSASSGRCWRSGPRSSAPQRPRLPADPSRLCGWCDHQALCPSFGGTPPPFPAEAAAAAGWASPADRGARVIPTATGDASTRTC